MGEADRRVPIAHGIRMRDAMKAAGNPVEWHSYPEEGHGWYLSANRIDFANRMERFFAKHLR
jgi:dipeptidyl aminopeptidase/acylaminoacyl peptidase